MQNAFNAVIAVTGMPWALALGLAFVAMICESAQAPRAPGEDSPPLTPLRFLTMVAALITPLFLLLHAVGASVEARQSFFLPVAAVIVVIAVASIIGALVGKVGAIGRPLHAVAPFISIPVCAFTIWVTWRLAWTLIDLYVMTHFR